MMNRYCLVIDIQTSSTYEKATSKPIFYIFAARLLTSLNPKLPLLSITISSTMNYQEKTQKFFRTIQAGDITLFKLIDDAIAVLGFTKVGKTSSCHILANSPLKAESLNGSLFYKSTAHRYKTAIIGNNNDSETQIPNIFDAKYKAYNGKLQSVKLLDQPGYGDGFGFNRIFANGYFHYRTFSKTPRLKFILAFKKADLQGTAATFKRTIFLFINTFKAFDKIKEKLLKATVFLITQADHKTKLDDLKNILRNLAEAATSNFTDIERGRYQQVIKNMLLLQKVFFIQKPQYVNQQTKQIDMLRDISQKTTFWERKANGNIVDMSDINFSVAFQIVDPLAQNGNENFKLEFKFFKNHMNKRVKDILEGHKFAFKRIIEILKEDAVGEIDSHFFLQGMKEFSDAFYKFDEKYKQKRQITEKQLFSQKNAEDLEETRLGLLNTNEIYSKQKNERQRQMKSTYFIKKFKVLEYIRDQAKLIPEIPQDRNIGWLESVSNFFINIFKKFNLLRVKCSDSECIIYKYSYIIQRLIQQSKIIALILFSNLEARQKFDSIELAMIDVFRPLNDHIFSRFQAIEIDKLKEDFINKVDYNSLEIVNKEIVTYFQSIDRNQKIVLKIANMILRYTDMAKEKRSSATDEDRKFLIAKLHEYRNKIYDYYLNLVQDKTNKEQVQACNQLIIKLSRQLGDLLLYFPFYSQAKAVFRSINSAQLVFQVFQMQVKALQATKKTNPKALSATLVEYGLQASQCCRRELALKCFQQAEPLCQTQKELDTIADLIVSLQTGKVVQGPYLKRLYNKKICEELPKALRVKIEAIYPINS